MHIRLKTTHAISILALGLAFLGGSFFFTPAQAHAASLREEIDTLKATIEDLRAQLSASVMKSSVSSKVAPEPMVTVKSDPTISNITASSVVSTSLKLGVKGEEVKKLQEKLSNLGYYKGAFDGAYGKGTADAVRAYQAAKGLVADGSAGAKTLASLGITFSGSTTISAKPAITPIVSAKPVKPSVKPVSGTPSSSKSGVLGQISMWYGKVNQHRSANGNWMTDPDGTAGAGNYAEWGNDGWGDRKLQYCQRFWPGTVAVEVAGEQTISGWRGRGNVGDSTSLKPVYNCVGDSEDDDEVVISQCDESDVEVSITGNTPEGIQPITQFNVLEFTIENNSDCDVLFEDVKVAYMTTDGKPYFDEIQIRGENGAFLGENDELQTDPNFHLGDRITISLSGNNGFEIDAGDHVDLMLRLVNYDQPVFDNTVPYNSFRHKYLMFGFIDEDDFDFKWGNVNNSPSFGATYTNNDLWGKKVRIPPSSL